MDTGDELSATGYLCHVPGSGEPTQVHLQYGEACAEAARLALATGREVRVYAWVTSAQAPVRCVRRDCQQPVAFKVISHRRAIQVCAEHLGAEIKVDCDVRGARITVEAISEFSCRMPDLRW